MTHSLLLRPELDLEQFRKGPISTVYYVPGWISEPEETAVLERIYSAPGGSKAWVPLRGRRLQMWGGEVGAPFKPEPLPEWLDQIAQALVDAGIFPPERKPNHALINGTAALAAASKACSSLIVHNRFTQSTLSATGSCRTRTGRATGRWWPS